MISTFSLQATQLDDPTEKILLPPTDPNAEVMEISGYKLVYVNGACPRNYRVYKRPIRKLTSQYLQGFETSPCRFCFNEEISV